MLENKQKTEKTGGKNLSRRKKRKKWLIPAAVLIVAAVTIGAVRFWSKKEAYPTINLTETTVLSYQDMEDSISASGTVESASTTTVYSTMAYPVMAVHVEVGDYVEEGQLLAELDGKTLQNQIITQEIGLDSASQSSALQIQSAQNNYENYKSGLDQGLNATLNSAKNQVETAYDNYLKAKTTYDRYAESLNVGENTTIINAESALRNARFTYETALENYNSAWEAYREARDLVELAEKLIALYEQWQQIADEKTQLEQALSQLLPEDPAYSDLQLQIEQKAWDLSNLEQEIKMLAEELLGSLESLGDLSDLSSLVTQLYSLYQQYQTALEQTEAALHTAEKNLENAAAAYESQQATYNATLTTVDNTLADYQTAMETAWKTYQNALTSLASTEKTVNEQLEAYASNVTSAQVNGENASGKESLRQMQENLDDTKITAPCAGTVTAVYAEVGSTGSGLLFVIEDVENLVIATSVKGYDVGTVQEGMEVVIRSDATGDAEMEGTVTSIAPTADKTTLGATASTTDPIFAAEVAVLSRNTGLRIGMSAQLEYILARESHVLAVPYDAVYKNEQGQSCILAAIEQGDELYLLQEIPVTTGLDDDLDMVVTGSGVREGLRIIHEPSGYLELVGQLVKAGEENIRGMAAFAGGRMP